MAFSFATLPQQIKLAFRGLSTGKLVAMAILVGSTIAALAFSDDMVGKRRFTTII